MNYAPCATAGCGGFDVEPCCPDGLKLLVCRSLAEDLCDGPPGELIVWPPEVMPTATSLALIWTHLLARQQAEHPAIHSEGVWGDSLDWAQARPDMIWRACIGLGRAIHNAERAES